MKSFFTKYKILFWLSAFVLIVNITVLIFLFYNDQKKSRQISCPYVQHNTVPHNGRFMKERLNLNEEQFNKFLIARRDFQNSAWSIRDRLNASRMEFIQELATKVPDTNKVRLLSKEIGDLHYLLKIETSYYYLNLKNICTVEQQDELNNFFMMMLRNEESDFNDKEQSGKRPMHRRDMKHNNLN